MKTFSLSILFILTSIALRAAEAHLTVPQVQAIASLVATEIYHGKGYTPSEPTYDKASGTWSLRTSNGMPHAELLINIRDKDAYYKVETNSGQNSNKEFKIHTSLKRQIAKIMKKDG